MHSFFLFYIFDYLEICYHSRYFAERLFHCFTQFFLCNSSFSLNYFLSASPTKTKRKSIFLPFFLFSFLFFSSCRTILFFFFRFFQSSSVMPNAANNSLLIDRKSVV